MSVARCQHEGCPCRADAESEFCSAYCANVEESESLPGHADLPGSCACGHTECAEARKPDPSGREVVTSTGRRD